MCPFYLASASYSVDRRRVEVVHGDTSSFVAMADYDSIGAHDNVNCLSDVDLSDYDLICCTKNGFVSAVLKPMDSRLNNLM